MRHYIVKDLALIVNINDEPLGYLEWSHECNEYVFILNNDFYLTGEDLEYIVGLKQDMDEDAENGRPN